MDDRSEGHSQKHKYAERVCRKVTNVLQIRLKAPDFQKPKRLGYLRQKVEKVVTEKDGKIQHCPTWTNMDVHPFLYFYFGNSIERDRKAETEGK